MKRKNRKRLCLTILGCGVAVTAFIVGATFLFVYTTTDTNPEKASDQPACMDVANQLHPIETGLAYDTPYKDEGIAFEVSTSRCGVKEEGHFHISKTEFIEAYHAFFEKHGCDLNAPLSCKAWRKYGKVKKGDKNVLCDIALGKVVDASRAKPKAPTLKAGFDPALVGCFFGAMAIVAWWQRKRAFDENMVMCSTDTATMALPPPLVFVWGDMQASMPASAKSAKPSPTKVEEKPPLYVIAALEEDSEEESPKWRRRYRKFYLKSLKEELVLVADNPALYTQICEEHLHLFRRDNDLAKKAREDTSQV